MIESTVEIRVIYGDTDQMGIVYYANYLRFFEVARGALMRERGRSYRDVEALGFAMPVIEAHVRYVRPARYEDVLRVTARVEAVRGASLRFSYDIARDDGPIAEGWTDHACVGPRGRPIRIPPALRELLGLAVPE
jgi:acyl-CoA thioester hydrolase